MDSSEKRELENELMVMGLPSLDDPALIQTLADIVNGYPLPAQRADFFCEMLNECVGARRREMYEAMRPRLSFDVPPLDACEARIAAMAERQIRPEGLPTVKAVDLEEHSVVMECHGCGVIENFTALTTSSAMLAARNAGWGRGLVRWKDYCPQCRLAAMPARTHVESLSARYPHALDS